MQIQNDFYAKCENTFKMPQFLCFFQKDLGVFALCGLWPLRPAPLRRRFGTREDGEPRTRYHAWFPVF